MERVSYLCLSVLEDLVSKIWNLILSEMPVIRTKNKVWTSNPHSVGFSFCYVICLGRFTWQYNSRQLKYKCAPVKWLGCCRNWVRKKLDYFFFFGGEARGEDHFFLGQRKHLISPHLWRSLHWRLKVLVTWLFIPYQLSGIRVVIIALLNPSVDACILNYRYSWQSWWCFSALLELACVSAVIALN